MTVLEPVKKFPIFHTTQKPIAVYIRSHWYLSWTSWI